MLGEVCYLCRRFCVERFAGVRSMTARAIARDLFAVAAALHRTPPAPAGAGNVEKDRGAILTLASAQALRAVCDHRDCIAGNFAECARDGDQSRCVASPPLT